jgi:hypothetical protein
MDEQGTGRYGLKVREGEGRCHNLDRVSQEGIGAVFEQHLHHVGAVTGSGPHEGRTPVLSARGRVCVCVLGLV